MKCESHYSTLATTCHIPSISKLTGNGFSGSYKRGLVATHCYILIAAIAHGIHIARSPKKSVVSGLLHISIWDVFQLPADQDRVDGHFFTAGPGLKHYFARSFGQDWLSDCGDPGAYLLQSPGTCEVWAKISVFVEVCRCNKGVGRDRRCE